MRFAKFLLKASRPGFWITSIWFYLLPLGGREVFGTAEFWIGLLYVTLPLGLLIYGWNDCADFEADRLNPRKDTFLFGARGSAEQLAVLPRWIALVQLPFAVVFVREIGVGRTAVFFAALTLATWLYNVPRGGLKTRPGFDLLNQAGYLLVFALSLWLNRVPALPWTTWVFGALFAMHSHLFGEIMDFEPDREAGRRTTALALGKVRAKGLMVGLLVVEAALLRNPWLSGPLAAGALWFVADALWLWRDRPYTTGQARFFFLGWNAAAIVAAPLVWRAAFFAAG